MHLYSHSCRKRVVIVGRIQQLYLLLVKILKLQQQTCTTALIPHDLNKTTSFGLTVHQIKQWQFPFKMKTRTAYGDFKKLQRHFNGLLQ